MDKVYMSWTCLIICAWLQVEPVFSNVILTLETKVMCIGKSVRFNCFIQDTSKPRSRQWIGGKYNSLLSFNGVSSNPNKFRETKMNDSNFTLDIFNITEDDLECPYACRYGFKSDEMMLNVNEKNFKYIPLINETRIQYKKINETYTLEINIMKVFPLPCCSLTKLNGVHHLNDPVIERNGIFSTVSYFVTSEAPLHDCDRPLEIVCNISYEELHIPVVHSLERVGCQISSEKERNAIIDVWHIILPVVALLLGIFVAVICGKRKCCYQYQQASTDQDDIRQPDMTPHQVESLL